MNRNIKLLQDAISRIEKTESLEAVLKHEFHYFKFIEMKLLPAIGEGRMYDFLKAVIKKEMDNGRLTMLRDVNIPYVCKIAFNSNVLGNKNYLSNRYPILRGIILKVIVDLRKENKLDSESILNMCKEMIEKRESLKLPLQLYKKHVDWKYLNFIEEILIPKIGEDEFYQYILDFQYNASSKGLITTYSNSELLNMLIDEEHDTHRQVIKSKERYPKLYNMVENAIRINTRNGICGEENKTKLNFMYKIKSFNILSEFDFLKKSKEIVEREFNNKRQRINKINFYRILFNEFSLKKDYFYEKINNELIHYNALNKFLEKEILLQRNYVEEWNKKSFILKNNIWIVHFVNGLSLHSMKVDFNRIKYEQLRREVKTYLFYDYNSANPVATYRKFTDIMRGLEVIQEKFKPRKVSDIDVIQVLYMYQYLEKEGRFSVVTIKKTISNLSQVFEYFLDMNGYKDRPLKNVFKAINMRNVDSMSKNTDFIPDVINEQLNIYISELDLLYRLMYELYSYTGLRPKEVVLLENDCFSDDRGEYPGYVKMKYIPHKIKKARRMRGLSDYANTYIPEELALKVKEYIAGNTDICSTYDINYVFTRRTHAGVFLPKTKDFCLAINKIIQKYNICDSEGELWNFTSKQTRKTVAVNLIENATPQEVANQLGHLDVRTTEKYYLEVKKAKLAEMNSEFFKNKFEVSVGKENLDLYSEEERRQLYVDFCLSKRDVELGKCSKHISEGDCGKRVGASNCAVCPKLCTGKNFLSKWNELRESQLIIVNELKKIYKDKGIENYHDFIEYKKELYLFERYSSVVNAILESEKTC
ncbi:tyrosine-type recombinase/integrase [Lysinibacillus xylanilyticus]|uniref:tyrosine-type recombinase/integrase n=1 Tax=Lysinibacillus xylanilyticus TaxID=582475 RepID=UPI0038274965